MKNMRADILKLKQKNNASIEIESAAVCVHHVIFLF